MIYRGGFGRLLFRWTFTFGNKASIFPGGLEPPPSFSPSFPRTINCQIVERQGVEREKEGKAEIGGENSISGGSRLNP